MDLRKLLTTESDIFSLAVRDDAVTFLLLKKTNQGLQKKFFTKVSLPAGVVEQGVLKNIQEFSKAIKACFDTVSGSILKKQNYVMLTIPDNEIFVKKYDFSSSLEESEINDSINLNASTQLPFPLADVYFDSEPRTLSKNGWQELLSVQAKKSVIDPYIKALHALNLYPIAIECETLSFVRTLNFDLLDPYLIIREDGDNYSLAFILEKQLRFFTYRKNLINDSKETTKTAQIAKILEYFLNYLEVEFNKTIKNIIFLCGAYPANFKLFSGVAEILKTNGREVGQFSLEEFVRIDVKTFLEKSNTMSLLPVFGLGLRTLINREDDKLISLLPVGTEESFLVRRSWSYAKAISDMVVFFTIILAVIFISAFVFIKFIIGMGMHRSFQATSNRSQPLGSIELENKAKEFSSLLVDVEHANSFKNKISGIFDELQSLITPGIMITSIKGGSEKSTTINISGIGLTREQVITFQDSLNSSKIFYDILLPLSSLATEKNVNFQITMKLR